MHELTRACLTGYMLVEREGRCRFSPELTTVRRGGILRRLLLLMGLFMLGTLLFASVALAQTTPSFVQEAETEAMVFNQQITADEACARGLEEFCSATA